MKSRLSTFVLCAAAVLLASSPVRADKPDWAGNQAHGQKGNRADDRDERNDRNDRDYRGDSRHASHFNDDARRIIIDYYGGQARAGKCPPGLAKKHNGCLPPGQAKKWSRGQPLPADLRYHDLPRDLLLRLPPPPARHRYVQVAGDILLIAIGSSMVVDAVEDILR